MKKSAFRVIIELNEAVYGFFSIEKPCQRASNSEIRRWFQKHCVEINGSIVTDYNVEIEVIKSIKLFPKNQKQRRSYYF
jgi:hypothetical protein